MVDSEYSPESYKSSKTRIGAIIKNSEMLTFVPNHPKIKAMCKHAGKKLPFIIRYLPDQFKT